MFFSVSPIKPGFRRRRRAAPLRLFQFLRNFFLLLLLSRSAFFFLLLSSSCAFSRGAALERISVSHFKAAAPQVPDAAVKVRGVRLRLSNQPMFRRTRWAATRLFPFQSELSIDFCSSAVFFWLSFSSVLLNQFVNMCSCPRLRRILQYLVSL